MWLVAPGGGQSCVATCIDSCPALKTTSIHACPVLKTTHPNPDTGHGSLAWMSSQENETKFKGGILADEMGMGKTIQTIACMMKNRAAGPNIGLPSKGKSAKSTLIICPQVAMVQWRGEIERYCAAGSLTLTMYHGPKRVSDPGV